MSTAPSWTTRAITSVLRHPIMMKIKGAWRDRKWSAMTNAPVNPPIPAEVTSILFVCLGNICRSPFAGELAARRLLALKLGAVVSRSAGIQTTQAKRSPAEACAAAAAYGVQLDTHVPQQLTPQMIEDADMVVVMEAAQFVSLRAMWPGRQDRIFLLSLWDSEASGAYARFNIADPFGQPLDAFRECYTRIDRAVDQLLTLLQAR